MKEANKSVIPDDDLNMCYICGKYRSSCVAIEEHHIFGAACRNTSDRYGLVVHLCRECHDKLHYRKDGNEIKQYLHRVGQQVYEERYGDRQKFIEEFIRSYL